MVTENYEVTDIISCTLYNVERRRDAGEEIFTLFDRRCDMSILKEKFYSNLRQAGLNCVHLQTQRVNIVSAFSNKRQRVKKQALLQVSIWVQS